MNEQQHTRRNNACLDAGKLITWRDGALPLREANEVTAHVAECARCSAEDRALNRECQQVFDLLSRLDPPSGVDAALAIARFRERFTADSKGSVLQYDDGDLHQEEIPLSSPGTYQPSVIPMKSSTRMRRISALAQTFAAILVVAALLGASLLLFRHRLPPNATLPANAPPIGPIGKPITVQTAVHGLEMTMLITPGPYFLSEMLAVKLSLTNHTHSIFLLQGTLHEPGTLTNSCQTPLKVVMTGVGRPYDPNLKSALSATISCYDTLGTVQLQPAQTITSYQYIALTSSGSVTFSARATFQKTALQNGVIQIVPTTSPLDGHWPSLQIVVQTGVPSDRAISLHQESTHVIVDSPPTARGKLIYLSVFDCDLGKGSNQHGGTDHWTGLQMMTIQKPQCGITMSNGTPIPGKFLRWTYVVGAPGYAMVTGKYPT